MRRREFLSGVALSTTIGFVGNSQAAGNRSSGVFEVKKGTYSSPLDERDIQEANAKVLEQTRNVQAASSEGSSELVVVPRPVQDKNERIVSYLFGITPDGITRLFYGTIREEESARRGHSVSASNHSQSNNSSASPEEAVEEVHSEMEQYSQQVSQATVRTASSDCETKRNFKINDDAGSNIGDAWGCPIVDTRFYRKGQNKKQGDMKKWEQLYTIRASNEGSEDDDDQYFASAANVDMIPGHNETGGGDSWGLHGLDVRHGWDDNTYSDLTSDESANSVSQAPKSIGSNGQLNGVGVGIDKSGASLTVSWSNPSATKMDNLRNDHEAHWDVSLNGERFNTKQFSFASVAQFDSQTYDTDDKVLRSECDGIFGKVETKQLGHWIISGTEKFTMDVDYKFSY
ncbi:hypothetical protein [Halomicrobium katesii]|uniref:hypothetical protein n=1 Tax=Halomicrobium katesii TaxID=437163 RepID=UPI0012BAC9A1|nr:hypothetical protein [Halomicrobium katesii]